MICEIALATGTAPAHWWNEPDEVLATVLDILEIQTEAINNKRR